VAEDGRVGIPDPLYNPLGLFCLWHLEATVNAGDDKIEAAQYAVRIVERTVAKNIRFNPFQDAKELAVAFIEPVRLAMLFGDLFKREAPRIVSGLRMVRDPEIFKAACPCRFRHRLKRLGAVGSSRVAMKYAVQVLIANKLRQPVFRGSRNFIASLAHLRLDELEPQGFIDILFRRRGDELSAAIKPVGFKFETLVAGKLLEVFKMFCRAGSIQEARAKMLLICNGQF
jgi:hypothetical protein